MELVEDVVSSFLLLGGVALAIIAGIGLLRFPDVFSRMHAATKPATLGLLMVCLGAALEMEDGSHRSKLLLVAAFQFLTAPVAAHMIGRAAYRSGTGALDDLVVDDLRGVSDGTATPQAVAGTRTDGTEMEDPAPEVR
ncbi:MAG TPA: monovalent cation/H(+) antiporter subunit G [Mycobacteriales bacterium]|nr:monovalent cation/H(+) antiporter subunit G [Mycobacteriales bacterium]